VKYSLPPWLSARAPESGLTSSNRIVAAWPSPGPPHFVRAH